MSQAKEWAKSTLKGLWSSPMVPMAKNGDIDHAGIQHNVEYLINSKADGLGFGFSEPLMMSVQERKEIFKTFIEAVGHRVPCYIHAVDYNVPDTIGLINYVQELGADAVMLWVPMEFAKSQDQAYDWYSYIAGQVPTMPVMAYNTFHSNIDLTFENLERIADIDNICALKEANNDFVRSVRSMSVVGDRIVVSHPIETDLPVMAMKMNMPVLLGSTSVYLMQSPNWQPIHDYLEAIQGGRNEDAWEQYYALQPLRDVWNSIYAPLFNPESATHPISYIKRWMDLLGMKGGYVRPPMHQATDAELAAFEERLTSTDLFKKLTVA